MSGSEFSPRYVLRGSDTAHAGGPPRKIYSKRPDSSSTLHAFLPAPRESTVRVNMELPRATMKAWAQTSYGVNLRKARGNRTATDKDPRRSDRPEMPPR